VITYELNPVDRNFRISNSTNPGKITILTFDFGRGTDFKLKGKDDPSNPGVHVICSFLPTSYSDYIQLTGRTARQGKNGSVMIFVPEDSEVTQNRV
jgi:preprotein translocase subunit SecA